MNAEDREKVMKAAMTVLIGRDETDRINVKPRLQMIVVEGKAGDVLAVACSVGHKAALIRAKAMEARWAHHLGYAPKVQIERYRPDDHDFYWTLDAGYLREFEPSDQWRVLYYAEITRKSHAERQSEAKRIRGFADRDERGAKTYSLQPLTPDGYKVGDDIPF